MNIANIAHSQRQKGKQAPFYQEQFHVQPIPHPAVHQTHGGESEAQCGVLITFLFKFTLKILVKAKNARLKTQLHCCSFPNKVSVNSEGLFWFSISSELLI